MERSCVPLFENSSLVPFGTATIIIAFVEQNRSRVTERQRQLGPTVPHIFKMAQKHERERLPDLRIDQSDLGNTGA